LEVERENMWKCETHSRVTARDVQMMKKRKEHTHNHHPPPPDPPADVYGSTAERRSKLALTCNSVNKENTTTTAHHRETHLPKTTDQLRNNVAGVDFADASDRHVDNDGPVQAVDLDDLVECNKHLCGCVAFPRVDGR
jgi:hypothetical protein